MAIRSLNRLRRLQRGLFAVKRAWLRLTQGVVVPASSTVSSSSRLCSGKRGSIRIGADTLVAFKTLVFTTDPVSGEDRPVTIGARCFIGGGSTVLPGVTIADECIVAAGAVVAADVPPRSIVAGNPARVVRSGIEVGRHGRLAGADETMRRLWQA